MAELHDFAGAGGPGRTKHGTAADPDHTSIRVPGKTILLPDDLMRGSEVLLEELP
jgi:hypothetical protein